MRFFILLLCLSACAHSVSDTLGDSPEVSTVSQQQAPPEEPEMIAIPKDPDACARPHFAADQIPYGFQYDPSCPPDIYAPPRRTPHWDPGPVIK